MAERDLRELADQTRALAVVPDSWNDDANTIDVVFSTGARVVKFCWLNEQPYVEDLPLSGCDCSELNEGASVLRNHSAYSVDEVVGSVVPGSAVVDLEAGEARATIQLSQEESDRELVGKIKSGIVRKLSYGYQKLGQYTVSTDEETGYEVRTWISHKPYEISFVAIGADPGAGTRAQTENPTMEDSMKDLDKQETPEVGTPETPTVDVEAIRAAAIADENKRQDSIRSAASKLGLSDTDDVRSMLSDPAVDADSARSRLIDLAAAKDEQTPTHPQVRVEVAEEDKRSEAMIEAMAFRARPKGQPSDLARPFVNHRLVDFAKESLSLAPHGFDLPVLRGWCPGLRGG